MLRFTIAVESKVELSLVKSGLAAHGVKTELELPYLLTVVNTKSHDEMKKLVTRYSQNAIVGVEAA